MKITSIHKNHFAEILRTLQLAAPVIIGLVAGFSMNFVDTLMAGRLPQKEIALAAIATGGALWSAALMFVIGLTMAVQPVVAQLDGANTRGLAGEAVRQGIWIALLVAVPFECLLLFGDHVMRWISVDATIIPTARQYLHALAWGAPAMCFVFLARFVSEGSGYTRPTMYIGLLGVTLNVPLNYVLMFGKLGLPALGARGIGYATAIVIWVQLLFMLSVVRWHPHFKEFNLFERWDWPRRVAIVKLVNIGLPIGMGIFVESGLFVAAALLIARLGPLPTSAHLIAINYAALMFMVPLGLASAMTTRVGNALGRGDPVAARYAALIGFSILLVTQTLSACSMLFLPRYIVSMYTDDAAITSIAVSLFLYAAIFQYADGLQVCSAGALRGYKDTLVPMFINIVSYMLIGLGVGYYLTFHRLMGPAGMWVGMIFGLSCGAVLLFSRFLIKSARLVRTAAVQS